MPKSRLRSELEEVLYETCGLIAVILDFEEAHGVEVVPDVEKRLELEVGPLHLAALLIISPVAIVVLREAELAEHLGIALALLLLRELRHLGALEGVPPLTAMLVCGYQRGEVTVLQVLVTYHHEQRADVADGRQPILGGQLLDVLRAIPIFTAAVPEDKLLLSHLGEVPPVNYP